MHSKVKQTFGPEEGLQCKLVTASWAALFSQSHSFYLCAGISSETNNANSWCNLLTGISVVSKSELVFIGQPKLHRPWPWLNCDYSWASLNAKFSTPEKGCMLYNPGQKIQVSNSLFSLLRVLGDNVHLCSSWAWDWTQGTCQPVGPPRQVDR